jgi:1,4-dihydroxy-2-naphthoyl-CoA hydrolase
MAQTGDTQDGYGATVPVGFVKHIGLTLVSATAQEVVGELTVNESHYQPMGIVHGGVYCAMVETVCSVGAHLAAVAKGRTVVGVDNQTSFLKATRTGVLRITARPLVVGGRTQLWEANVKDEGGALVATGRVRLMCLELTAKVAGAALNER